MNKFMKKLMKKSEGFTLVELIVVIAILAILAGIAIPAYSGYITKAKDAAAITELDAIATAAQAANAAKGEIDKIEVVGTSVTVTASVGFADNYDDDFLMYYAATDADANTTGVFTLASDILDGTSYDAGATWEDGEWTAD